MVGGIFSSLRTAVNATASSVETLVLQSAVISSVQYSNPDMYSVSTTTLICFPNSQNTMGKKESHL